VRPLVRAVIAISAPLDLAVVSKLLGRPLNLPYRAYILHSLLAQARTFARLHPQRTPFAPSRLRRVFSIWDYDDVVVAPMHGFGTAERYYAQMSSGQVLPSIEIPTLLIHANDDPLVPGATVEPFLAKRSKAVEIAWSERGGHVGWFSGLGEPQWLRTWAIDRALSFLEPLTR
jgi:predicted alpha/beta-fold hydrolase